MEQLRGEVATNDNGVGRHRLMLLLLEYEATSGGRNSATSSKCSLTNTKVRTEAVGVLTVYI